MALDRTTPFENDPFVIVMQAFRNLYPSHEFTVDWSYIDEKDDDGKPVYGFTSFNRDGTIEVFVSCSITVSDAVEILAHELAHVAVGVNEDHGEIWEAAFEAIFQEYNRISAEEYGGE